MMASVETEGWRPLPADLERPGGGTEMSSKRGRRWQLVLTAMQIDSRVEASWMSCRLLVREEAFPRALEQLRRYEQENRGWPPPPPELHPERGSLLVTLSVVLLAASFYNLSSHVDALREIARFDWYGSGMLHAGRVRHGELWRALTALTLHADALHLAGNGIVATLFVERLRKVYGSGLTWTLFLVTGTCGNLLNALLQPYHHQAVGASTAVFGLLGVIATDSLVRYRHALWRRWAMPLASACALLGLLGTSGEHTDLGAHLWGFVSGLPFGVLLARHYRRRPAPGSWLNRAFAVAAITATAIAWALALSPPPG